MDEARHILRELLKDMIKSKPIVTAGQAFNEYYIKCIDVQINPKLTDCFPNLLLFPFSF